jgi:hypothetical protein
MKLSEALRKGILIKPIQAFGCFTTNENDADVILSIIKGCEIPHNELDLVSDFPSLNKVTVCPATPLATIPVLTLYTVLLLLNDDFKWSREKIADWLENIGE